jgi:hypothetical protein
MQWYQQKPIKRDEQIIRDFARSLLKVNRIFFAKHDIGCRGYCHYNHKTNWISITLCLKHNTDRRKLYSTLMHELAHIICFQQGIYPAYHIRRSFRKMSQKDKIALRRTALRAELYVDSMGERMFRTFFPNVQYDRGYNSKESREFLRMYWQDEFQGKRN